MLAAALRWSSQCGRVGFVGRREIDQLANVRGDRRRDGDYLGEQAKQAPVVGCGSWQAFAGADAVFWPPLPDPRPERVDASYVGFTRPAAEAFKAAFSQACRRDLGSRPWHSLGSARRLCDRGRSAWDDLTASTGVSYRAPRCLHSWTSRALLPLRVFLATSSPLRRSTRPLPWASARAPSFSRRSNASWYSASAAVSAAPS